MRYGTAAHAAALERLGPCAEHRFSYAPVAAIVGKRAAAQRKPRTLLSAIREPSR